MDGYVATARIARVSPRLAATPRAIDARTTGTAVAPSDSLIVEDGRVVVGSVSPSFSERRRAFRERWSQLTFYLVSPDSWR